MTNGERAKLQAVNRLVGRCEALSEAITVLSAMQAAGMRPDEFTHWLFEEQDRNVADLRAAGAEPEGGGNDA